MSYFVFAECNHFNVSCERLFNPGLEGLPVIVLSDPNDYVLALSQEAKNLGIKTGDSFAKIKAFCARMNVIIFTSNDKLYGEVSHRVMNLLSSVAEEIEVNTLGEAFLKFSSSRPSDKIIETCNEVREKIKKWVGIPISMGIAQTKALAKIANEMAKRDSDTSVFDLTSPSVQKKILERYALWDVYELEPRLKEQLLAMGIRSAWEFCQMEPSTIRCRMGIKGGNLHSELRGASASTIEMHDPSESISYARSFGKIISNPKELTETVSTFVSGACIQLGEHKSCAKTLFVSLEAIFDENKGSHSTFSISSSFPMPTNDKDQIVSSAKQCVSKLYSPTERYTKCEVRLLDLMPIASEEDLLPLQRKRRKVLESVEALNAFYDKNTLNYGTMDIGRAWKMKPDQNARNRPEWQGLAFALAK